MWLFQKHLALFWKLELMEKRLRKLVLFLFDMFIMLVYGVGESSFKRYMYTYDIEVWQKQNFVKQLSFS